MIIRYCSAVVLSLVLAASLVADEPQVKPTTPGGEKHVEQSKQGLKLFQDSIRGILTEHCLDCHGGKSTKADFDLATRDALLDSGFVEDTADGSFLLELIRHEAEPAMPFKADKLSEESIAQIAKWIDLGAPYDQPLADRPDAAKDLPMQVTDEDRKFWSFAPLADVAPPELANDTWSRQPIDRFVVAKQREAGVTGNPVAARPTLIRRAYLDLLGLPPSPDQVAAFVNDPDPLAYEKLIDSLLESEHYGERWARHWMDVARFAESTGFEHDYDRKTAYHYRDFLIQAFNDDMPWDQMTRWQLAGDELAPEDHRAWMATGFLAAGVFPTQLTEAEFESARYDELDDIVATMGVSFLGLSTGCARCHDHKFDPIPTRDYYALVATFAKTIRSEKALEFTPDDYPARLESWQQRHTELTAELSEYESQTLEPKFAAWLATAEIPEQSSDSPWQILEPAEVRSRGNVSFSRQPDGAWLASGEPPAQDEYTILADAPAGAAALRIEALTHASMPRRGPGRASNGNFALGNLTVDAVPLDTAADVPGTPLSLVHPRATHQQNTGGLSVASSLDDDINTTGWAVDFGGIGKDQAAIFELEQPLATASRLVIRMRFHVNTKHALGRFRLSVSKDAKADFALGEGTSAEFVSAVEKVRAGNADQLSAAQRRLLRDWFAAEDAHWQQLRRAVADHNGQKPALETRNVLIYSEGVQPLSHHADGRGYPHFYPEVHLLKRGDPKQKQQQMDAGTLQVLPQLPQPSGDAVGSSSPPPPRSRLAAWITDPDEGAGFLLARVIVNRLWHHHFGNGIVTTPNDFGFQGARPTHPELLDWLARDLIDHGWKLKRLHKQMMTTATYMQNSEIDEARTAADIDNQWLWRFQPRRLEAEAIRDSMLATSGRLDRSMYGPGTLDQNMRRRSVYFTIKRSRFIPMMQIFDWPEHLVSIGKRSDTAIAPQALALMNGPEARSDAAALAALVRSQTTSIEEAIADVYLRLFSRPATSQEAELAASFIQSQAARYGDAEPGQSAALVDFCQALYCSNEFLYLP